MEKELLEIMGISYFDYLNSMSKYKKVWLVTKLKLRLDHYGQIY